MVVGAIGRSFQILEAKRDVVGRRLAFRPPRDQLAAEPGSRQGRSIAPDRLETPGRGQGSDELGLDPAAGLVAVPARPEVDPAVDRFRIFDLQDDRARLARRRRPNRASRASNRPDAQTSSGARIFSSMKPSTSRNPRLRSSAGSRHSSKSVLRLSGGLTASTASEVDASGFSQTAGHLTSSY